MNRTGEYIQGKADVLSIYFTAEYPQKGTTQEVILSLQDAGVDLIEVGIPFSDPLADGPVIQKSSQQALKNGFTLDGLFEDLKAIQADVTIPLVLMGYFNTALAYGMERFLAACKNVGVDTVILPDLPLAIYKKSYTDFFAAYGVSPVFLITPQTSNERIRQIDDLSNAFIYVVADNSITGGSGGFSTEQLHYFERIQARQLSVPLIIGFGISSHNTYRKACEYAQGAIIGTAFIKALADSTNIKQTISTFIQSIKQDDA